jgi:hypothetical protein
MAGYRGIERDEPASDTGRSRAAALSTSTQQAIASTTPRSRSASSSLRYHPRGGRCGSAWTRSDIYRQLASTPRGASSIFITNAGAPTVRLLDLGSFRTGSEDYAERNESFGLTTMLREPSRSASTNSFSISPRSPASSGAGDCRRGRLGRRRDAQAQTRWLPVARLPHGESMDGVHADEVNAYLEQYIG